MKANKKSPKWQASLKQTIMLKKALVEEGINPDECKIKIDHDLGCSYVNEFELPIIFPKSHFDYAKKCHSNNKRYMFYFTGNPGKGNTRILLMKDFINKNDSKLIFNGDGRIVENKGNPNPIYFKEMSESHFSLCPHQPNWRGNWDALWTYRYIESLILKAMPVQFKSTPLAETFTKDSIFRWDDDTFDNMPTEKELEFNYKFAESKFCLSEKQIKNIKKSIC